MARNRALERVLRLTNLLRRRRHRLDELADECGVTVRTVRRDLETLSVVGIPVQRVEVEDGPPYWYIERHDTPILPPRP